MNMIKGIVSLDTGKPKATCEEEVFLQELIEPVPLDIFRTQYLHQSPLIISGENKNYSRFFNVDDLDRLFAASAPNIADWFFFRSDSNVPREDFSNEAGQVLLNRINALYHEGGTIHLRNIQKYLPDVERIHRLMEKRFQARLKVNLWLTRHNEFSPYLHYDTHDLFILQINGEKHWKFYERDPTRFAPRSGAVALTRQRIGAMTHDVIVRKGDLIYIPAGTPHEVTTCAPHSLHLAIGVFPVLWRDVMTDILAEMDLRGSVLGEPVSYATFNDEARLRRALADMMSVMAGQVDVRALSTALRMKFVHATVPRRDTHFSRDILADVKVDSDTRLRRRPGPCETWVDEARGLAQIIFADGGGMEGPADIKEMLDIVATADGPITLRDLPEIWDLDSRSFLLGELLHRGLLERAF